MGINKSTYFNAATERIVKLGIKGASVAVRDVAHRYDVLLSPILKRVRKQVSSDRVSEIHREVFREGTPRNIMEAVKRVAAAEYRDMSDQDFVAFVELVEGL